MSARAALESRVERRLHAALRSGRKFTGDLAVSFYQQFGISAKTLDGIHRQLKGKLDAITELAKLRVAELDVRVGALRRKINDAERALRRATEDERRHRKRFSLHQHRWRLATLEARQVQAGARIDDPRICFGSRKLFNAQHYLADNGFDDHKDWIRAWRAARSSQFFIEGDGSRAGGNPFVRLTGREDATFDLELRLPEMLGYLAHDEAMKSGHTLRSTYFTGLHFEHGAAEIREALAGGKPLSYRFRCDDGGRWYVSVMLRQDFADPSETGFSGGCLGVDLNVDHVALTLTDATGNPLTCVPGAPGKPVMTRRIDLVSYGKTRAQRLDMIRKAAAEIAALADRLGVPVAAE